MVRKVLMVSLSASLMACAAGGGGGRPSTDSGTRDTGTSPDSGAPDSGTVDSGGVDSGVPDTGTVDSGALDSDVLDTSVGVDAGESDSGTDAGFDAGFDAAPMDAGCTGTSCDDGDACNGVETCVAGSCVPGTPMVCDDGVACTIDSCAASACTHTPDSTMCLPGLTCIPGRGCGDPSCTEMPCQLTAPQCGCPTGQGCYLTPAGDRTCSPAGTVPEGGDCAAVQCVPGNGCVNVGTAAAPVGQCKRWCNSDADCSAGPGDVCIINLGGPDNLCTSNCDPVTQTGCSATSACSIFEEMSGRRLTDCAGPVGTGGQGSVCVDDTNCQRGFACINTASGSQCLKWCRRGIAVNDCSSLGFGFVCGRLGPAPGLIFNGIEYGACIF
ncbi:MAG: hypothetical protein AAGE52_10100 [Myxococcota bacterium]